MSIFVLHWFNYDTWNETCSAERSNSITAMLVFQLYAAYTCASVAAGHMHTKIIVIKPFDVGESANEHNKLSGCMRIKYAACVAGAGDPGC